jgi:hypothetical protein
MIPVALLQSALEFFAATFTKAVMAKKAAYITMSGLLAFGGGTGW